MVDKAIIIENKIKKMENPETIFGEQHQASLASVRAFL
jgi:hypothetical protein